MTTCALPMLQRTGVASGVVGPNQQHYARTGSSSTVLPAIETGQTEKSGAAEHATLGLLDVLPEEIQRKIHMHAVPEHSGYSVYGAQAEMLRRRLTLPLPSQIRRAAFGSSGGDDGSEAQGAGAPLEPAVAREDQVRLFKCDEEGVARILRQWQVHKLDTKQGCVGRAAAAATAAGPGDPASEPRQVFRVFERQAGKKLWAVKYGELWAAADADVMPGGRGEHELDSIPKLLDRAIASGYVDAEGRVMAPATSPPRDELQSEHPTGMTVAFVATTELRNFLLDVKSALRKNPDGTAPSSLGHLRDLKGLSLFEEVLENISPTGHLGGEELKEVLRTQDARKYGTVFPTISEREAEARLRDMPSSQRQHCVGYPGWSDMTWNERLAVALDPSARGRGSCTEQQAAAPELWLDGRPVITVHAPMPELGRSYVLCRSQSPSMNALMFLKFVRERSHGNLVQGYGNYNWGPPGLVYKGAEDGKGAEEMKSLIAAAKDLSGQLEEGRVHRSPGAPIRAELVRRVREQMGDDAFFGAASSDRTVRDGAAATVARYAANGNSTYVDLLLKHYLFDEARYNLHQPGVHYDTAHHISRTNVYENSAFVATGEEMYGHNVAELDALARSSTSSTKEDQLVDAEGLPSASEWLRLPMEYTGVVADGGGDDSKVLGLSEDDMLPRRRCGRWGTWTDRSSDAYAEDALAWVKFVTVVGIFEELQQELASLTTPMPEYRAASKWVQARAEKRRRQELQGVAASKAAQVLRGVSLQQQQQQQQQQEADASVPWSAPLASGCQRGSRKRRGAVPYVAKSSAGRAAVARCSQSLNKYTPTVLAIEWAPDPNFLEQFRPPSKAGWHAGRVAPELELSRFTKGNIAKREFLNEIRQDLQDLSGTWTEVVEEGARILKDSTGSDIDHTLDDADDTKQKLLEITEQAHRRLDCGCEEWDHRFGCHRRRYYDGSRDGTDVEQEREQRRATHSEMLGRLCQASHESTQAAMCFGAHVAVNYAQVVEKVEAARAGCIGPPPGNGQIGRKANPSLSDDDDELESALRSLDIVHPTELGVVPPRGGPGAKSALHYGLARVSRKGRELAAVC